MNVSNKHGNTMETGRGFSSFFKYNCKIEDTSYHDNNTKIFLFTKSVSQKITKIIWYIIYQLYNCLYNM